MWNHFARCLFHVIFPQTSFYESPLCNLCFSFKACCEAWRWLSFQNLKRREKWLEKWLETINFASEMSPPFAKVVVFAKELWWVLAPVSDHHASLGYHYCMLASHHLAQNMAQDRRPKSPLLFINLGRSRGFFCEKCRGKATNHKLHGILGV